MNQLTIMLLVPDRARADVLLREDRVYYRFATESTMEDGDLPGLKENFVVTVERLLDDLKPREGERVIPADEVKVSLFVDNVAQPISKVTEEGLRRAVDRLVRLDDVFGFLKGFV